MSTREGKNARSIKNFILDPLLQFRFGAYMIAIIFLFFGTVALFTYYTLNEFINLLIILSEVPQSMQQYLNETSFTFVVGLIVILLLFSFFSLVFIVVQTHRIVGAGYAIRRHIREHLLKNDFDTKLVLRKKDYFKDIADVLNEFSSRMKDRKNG